LQTVMQTVMQTGLGPSVMIFTLSPLSHPLALHYRSRVLNDSLYIDIVLLAEDTRKLNQGLRKEEAMSS
jgi:hypothetical protein